MDDLRSGKDMVGGVVFLCRTLDKIRLRNECKLPPDYNLGTGYDARLCEFLGVIYEELRRETLRGGTDEEVLEWCYSTGRRPTDQELLLWNSFVSKQGWNDDTSERLEGTKAARGFSGRTDIQTWLDFHDADEGRM